MRSSPENTTQPAPGPQAPPTPLDEYRRVLSALREEERSSDVLRERLVVAQEEIDDLYTRLSREQTLRREAQVTLEASRAEIDAASTTQQTISNLQAALHAARAELATVNSELKARREELMKIVLEQQEWNRYVLDRLRPH